MIAHDCLLNIVSFCTTTQLSSVLAVNSEWHQLVHSDYLWREYYRNYLDVNIEECTRSRFFMFKNSRMDRFGKKWRKLVGEFHSHKLKVYDHNGKYKEYFEKEIKQRKFSDLYLVFKRQVIGEIISKERKYLTQLMRSSLNEFDYYENSVESFHKKWKKVRDFINNQSPKSIRFYHGNRRDYLLNMSNFILARIHVDIKRISSTGLAHEIFNSILDGEFLHKFKYEPLELYKCFAIFISSENLLDSRLRQCLMNNKSPFHGWAEQYLLSYEKTISFIAKHCPKLIDTGSKIINHSIPSSENREYLLKDPRRIVGYNLFTQMKSNICDQFSSQLMHILKEYRFTCPQFAFRTLRASTLSEEEKLEVIQTYEKIHNKRIVTANVIVDCVYYHYPIHTIKSVLHLLKDSTVTPLIFLITNRYIHEEKYCLELFESIANISIKMFDENIKEPFSNPLLFIMKYVNGRNISTRTLRWKSLILKLASNSNLDYVNNQGMSFLSILNDGFPSKIKNLILQEELIKIWLNSKNVPIENN